MLKALDDRRVIERMTKTEKVRRVRKGNAEREPKYRELQFQEERKLLQDREKDEASDRTMRGGKEERTVREEGGRELAEEKDKDAQDSPGRGSVINIKI